jgi:hypothetical protein
MSFVKDVWYGQRSLAETFWLWNVLIGTVVLGYGGIYLVGLLIMQIRNLFPFFLYFALTLPYSVWITVGLWRSARNNPSGCATLVLGLIVIGIPLTIYNWITLFQMVL